MALTKATEGIASRHLTLAGNKKEKQKGRSIGEKIGKKSESIPDTICPQLKSGREVGLKGTLWEKGKDFLYTYVPSKEKSSKTGLKR